MERWELIARLLGADDAPYDGPELARAPLMPTPQRYPGQRGAPAPADPMPGWVGGALAEMRPSPPRGPFMPLARESELPARRAAGRQFMAAHPELRQPGQEAPFPFPPGPGGVTGEPQPAARVPFSVASGMRPGADPAMYLRGDSRLPPTHMAVRSSPRPPETPYRAAMEAAPGPLPGRELDLNAEWNAALARARNAASPGATVGAMVGRIAQRGR